MTIINELDSTCGISDEELTVRFKESIRIDKEVRKIKGLPIAGYDEAHRGQYGLKEQVIFGGETWMQERATSMRS